MMYYDYDKIPLQIHIGYTIGNVRQFYLYNTTDVLHISESTAPVWGEYVRLLLDKHLKSPIGIDEELLKEAEKIIEKKKADEIKKEQKDFRDRHRRKLHKVPIKFIPNCKPAQYHKAFCEALEPVLAWEVPNAEEYLFLLRYLERWIEKSVPYHMEIGHPELAYAIVKALNDTFLQLLFRDELADFIDKYQSRLCQFVKNLYSTTDSIVDVLDNRRQTMDAAGWLISSMEFYEQLGCRKKILQALIPNCFL